MFKTNQPGGILLYVLIIGIVISIFTSVLTNIFGSLITSTRDIKNYFHRDYAMDNIVKNSLVRYWHDYNDPNIYEEQIGLNHTLTRYKKDEAVFLLPNISDQKKYQWEFNNKQVEQVFYGINKSNVVTNLYDNDLEKIKTWKIFWNAKTDNKAYNPLARDETTRIKISLERIGLDRVKKCFITSGANSSHDVFKQEIVLSESITQLNDNFYKYIDTNIDGDCDKVNDGINLLVLNDGYLDFVNNSYILTVEALDSPAHVLVNGVDISDNIVAIPTNTLEVEVSSKTTGNNLNYTTNLPNCFDKIQNRDEIPEAPDGGLNHFFDDNVKTGVLDLGTYVIKSQNLSIINPKSPLLLADLMVTSSKTDLITITNANFSFNKKENMIIVWAKYEMKRASNDEADNTIINIKYKNTDNNWVNLATDTFTVSNISSDLVLDETIPDYCGGTYCGICPSYPEDISDLQLVGFNYTEVDLSWSKPADNGAIITNYIIHYNDGTNYHHYDTESTATNVTISDLLPDTIYSFSISAINSKGRGGSNTILVPNIPEAIKNLQATPGDSFVKLEWDVPDNNSLDIIDYVIKYSEDGANYQVFDDGVDTNNFVTVSNLDNGTLYYFSVVAKNSLGEGINSIIEATPN